MEYLSHFGNNSILVLRGIKLPKSSQNQNVARNNQRYTMSYTSSRSGWNLLRFTSFEPFPWWRLIEVWSTILLWYWLRRLSLAEKKCTMPYFYFFEIFKYIQLHITRSKKALPNCVWNGFKKLANILFSFCLYYVPVRDKNMEHIKCLRNHLSFISLVASVWLVKTYM